MDLLSTWRTQYKLRYCPVTLIQTAFSAGTVYLLIAMQAVSGTRIARKELRHSLDQETLVQQYLQEIGSSWNCATIISVNLRNLMNEQVRPHLELMDRKNIPTTPGLHISDDIGDDDDDEDNSSRSRSTSRPRLSVNNTAPQISHPHNMSSGSGQYSLSTSTNHVLTSTFPTQIPPPSNPSISPTITVPSSRDTSPTHTIRSLRSTSFTNSWHFPSPGSSPDFNYVSPSSSHSDFRNYAQPFSNDPFSVNGNSGSDDVYHAFGGLVSSLSHNVEGSPSSEHLAMLGGQTLSELPFVGILSRGEDTHSSHFSNFVQARFRTGFPNRESSSNSLGRHVSPSSPHGNDNMDLDGAPWRQQSFSS